MAERKYTLAEIEEMRKLIGLQLPQPLYEYFAPAGGGPSRPTEESERAVSSYRAAVEDRLRTAITAGLGPEDLQL